MDVRFLFGWAEEQGVDVPTKSDGSANINELFALYNEWKKKQTAARRATLRDKGVDTDGMDDAAVEQRYEEYTGKASGVVELDENSELARCVKGLYENKRYKAIMEYLREAIGNEDIKFHDGITAKMDGGDAKKIARDAYHKGSVLRRTAELSVVQQFIENARYKKTVARDHDKFSSCRYYAVTTRYNGVEDQLLLNVGKNKFTGAYHFHAITHDEEK